MSANNYSFFYFAHFRPRSHFLHVQSQQRKLLKKGWNLCNIRMHTYYLMYLRPGFDTKNDLVILFINWSNMFGCLNEVKKWKINLLGNKSRISQKFYENQQVREKDFERSNSRYCSCSVFSFSAVGHGKKKRNASICQKNHTLTSDSSCIFPRLIAAGLIYHNFLMGTRRQSVNYFFRWPSNKINIMLLASTTKQT